MFLRNVSFPSPIDVISHRDYPRYKIVLNFSLGVETCLFVLQEVCHCA